MYCEPAEHNHQHGAGRWESLEPLFRKGIGLEFAILESPNQVLVFLIIAVQDREIEIGGSLVDMRGRVIGLENVYISD